MKETESKPVSALLQPNHNDLQTVLSKVKAIQTLNQTIIPLLDDSLQKYCQVANLANGVLVLLTANGSVASQMRYVIPDLLRKLRSNPSLRHIHEIQCKVRPQVSVGVERGAAKRKPKKVTLLSADTAATLLDMAETIEDPELRAIMQRIAQNTETKLPPK
jgi:hypothetical protein